MSWHSLYGLGVLTFGSRLLDACPWAASAVRQVATAMQARCVWPITSAALEVEVAAVVAAEAAVAPARRLAALGALPRPALLRPPPVLPVAAAVAVAAAATPTSDSAPRTARPRPALHLRRQASPTRPLSRYRARTVSRRARPSASVLSAVPRCSSRRELPTLWFLSWVDGRSNFP